MVDWDDASKPIDFQLASQRIIESQTTSKEAKHDNSLHAETYTHKDAHFTVVSFPLPNSLSMAEGSHALSKITSDKNALILQTAGLEDYDTLLEGEKGKATLLKKDIADVIISEYNPAIMQVAGIDPLIGLRALLAKRIQENQSLPNSIQRRLSLIFQIPIPTLEELYRVVRGNVANNSAQNLFDYYNKIIQVSNDLSWRALHRAGFKGEVAAVVGRDHTEIFDPNYKPEKEYSQEETDQILAYHKKYEQRLEEGKENNTFHFGTSTIEKEDFRLQEQKLIEEASQGNEIAKHQLLRLRKTFAQKLLYTKENAKEAALIGAQLKIDGSSDGNDIVVRSVDAIIDSTDELQELIEIAQKLKNDGDNKGQLLLETIAQCKSNYEAEVAKKVISFKKF